MFNNLLSICNISQTSCADPEIFMRGGPTKMVIFGQGRVGWVQPPQIPKLPFLCNFFQIPAGVGSGPPVPPSGPAHEHTANVRFCH